MRTHEGDAQPLATALHLEAVDGPPLAFGFFLVSESASASLPVSNGVLCLDFPLARYNSTAATVHSTPSFDSLGLFNASGVFSSLMGNSSVPGNFI